MSNGRWTRLVCLHGMFDDDHLEDVILRPDSEISVDRNEMVDMVTSKSIVWIYDRQVFDEERDLTINVNGTANYSISFGRISSL